MTHRTLLILALLIPSLLSQDPRLSSRLPRGPAPQPQIVVTNLNVQVTVDGPGALMEQQITLLNRGPVQGEYDLIFPMDPEAIMTDITLKLGDQVLEGRTYPKEEAARIYQQITRANRDPALLEHYGEGLFRARVAPLLPNKPQVLTLTYRFVVGAHGDSHRIRVPLTAWRRSAGPMDISIKGILNTTHPTTILYSPTHQLTASKVTKRESRYPYQCTFSQEAKAQRPDSDFVLAFRATSTKGLVDVAVLSDRPDPKEPGYFLAVINGIENEDLKPEPKDVVFVIDRSGSMKGPKIEQAKGALKFLLERLGPDDRFGVVSYSNTADQFSTDLLAPTADNVQSAIRMVEGLDANGGTNIIDALSISLAQLKDSKRLSQVVFITDGLPTVKEKNHRKITEAVTKLNTQHTRIVAFGVGFDVNGAFLDRLAVQNHGLSEYVLPSENLEDKIPGFYSRMQSPLLLDLAVSIAGTTVHDVYPKMLGDLYGGHQVVIAGRYTDANNVKLTVSGRRNSEAYSQTTEVQLASASGDRLVPRVWATQKIGYLVDEIRLNGTNKELVNAVVDLGTKFGILTEYTSFLAAPDVDLSSAMANRRRGGEEFERKAQVESGSQGVSQAANSKGMQRLATGTRKNAWLGADGSMETISTVLNTNGQTFFKKGKTWLQTGLANDVKVDEEVEYFSDRFFEALSKHQWLNRCLARTGDLTLKLDGKLVRFRNKAQ